MFIQNKYYKYYLNLVDCAKSRLLENYTEKHHIIPKSLGGDDSENNLVCLTAREHFIAHLLLTKITLGENKSKMINAIFCMINMNQTKVNSRIYEKLKKEHSKYMKEKNPVFSDEVKLKISNTLKEHYKTNKVPFQGKKHTEKTKKILSQKRKGIIFTEEHKQKIANSHLGKKHSNETKNKIAEQLQKINYKGKPGKPHSEETRKKMSEKAKLRWSNVKNEKNINSNFSSVN